MKSLCLFVSVALVGCSHPTVERVTPIAFENFRPAPLTSDPQIHYVTRAEIADVVRSGRVTLACFAHSGSVSVLTDDGHVYRSVSRTGDTTDIGLARAPNRRKITIMTE